MRKDQVVRLQGLAEEIADVFIEEADPRSWTGSGQPLSDMAVEARGNRYWDKKNAIQTGTLLARVLDLRDRENRPDVAPEDDDAEEQIKTYEKRAKDLISALQSRSKQH